MVIFKDLNRPGAKQLLISIFLSIASLVAGFVFFGQTIGRGSDVGSPAESVVLICPILVAILGWQATIGFRKLARDKGFSEKRIESLLRQGLIGFYLVFAMPADTTGYTTSLEESTNAKPLSGISTAKQIKLILVFLVSAAAFALVFPWMFWFTNYAQAEDDFKHGSYNDLRIDFAETLLNKYPNAQDMAKVLTLKAKIYKTFADELTSKLPNWTKKEQAERKAEISKLYATATTASTGAAKLSNEHWGTSSLICYGAIGVFFLTMLGLTFFIANSED